MYGWNNVLLRVNLTDKTVRKQALPHELLRNYAGQFTLAARCWTRLNEAGAPEEDRIVIMTGPMTGMMGEGTNRYALAYQGRNGFCAGSCGGRFGAELKLAGYDGVIIEGRAEAPVYLCIRDGAAQLRDASAVWDQNVDDTVCTLTAACAPGAGTLCIGQAAEQQCAFAAAVGDRLYLSPGGFGTVMGAMRLKGVVVRGSGAISVANPEEYLACALESRRRVSEDPFAVCLGSNEFQVTADVLRNLQKRPYAGYRHAVRQIDWRKPAACTTVVRRACYSCTVGCRKCVRMTDGTQVRTLETPAPEVAEVFERACGVTALEAQLDAFELCRQYGMDPAACSCAVGLVMRLADAGLLASYGEEGGAFGNPNTMVRLVSLIGQQRGVGALAARGVRVMAEQLNAAETAAQVCAAVEGRCGIASVAALRKGGKEEEQQLALLAFAQDCGICPYTAMAYTEYLLCRTLRAVFGQAPETREIGRLGAAVRQILENQTKGVES